MTKHKYADRIIAGNYNLALDPSMDSKNRKVNNEKLLMILKDYMEQSMTVDIWRELNPKIFNFTFRQKKPRELYVRLDYILIKTGLTPTVKKCQILPAYKSDHSMVMLELEPTPLKRGKGLWKLNTSLLHDEKVCQKVNDAIDKTVEHASINGLNPAQQWEKLKAAAISILQKEGLARSKWMKHDVGFMWKRLTELQSRLANMENNMEKEAIEEKMNECNRYLEQYMEYKSNGARIRSKYRWYAEGNKSTWYFLGIEKVKYSNKTMSVMLLENNAITKDEKQILKEQFKYYKRLYTVNPDICFNLELDFPVLEKDLAKDIDQAFTFEEFT